MPSLRDTIQPFVDRLLRNPGVLMTDPAFFRSFNSLGLPLRVAVMDRVEAVRRQQMDRSFERQHRDIVRMVSVDTGANGDATTVVSGHLSTDRHGISTVTIDEVEELTRSDEENARLDRIAEMRRDMAREIEEFRFQAVEAYQRRMPQDRTTAHFQRWSQWVEANARDIRSRWDQRIADETRIPTPRIPTPRPSPPQFAWPDPADYGPNGRYTTQRGALSAFSRAVNGAHGSMTQNVANLEARDRIHINGTMEIRSLWRDVPRAETAGERWRRTHLNEHVRWSPGLPSVPPPPPTTTAWVDEPEVDELDIMIKHLPRYRKFMVVVPSTAALVAMKNRLLDDGRPTDTWHVHTVSMLQGESTRIVRNLRIPVFIDPAVFKMHAKREGDWTDEQLDAIIELQGEIPDEETT